jgi:hypothetical protein
MNNTDVHTVYSGRSTNWPMIWLSTALLIPFVALAKESKGSWTAAGFAVPLLIAVTAAVANLLTATSVRTTAGPNGVTVHFGVVGWPRFRYPMQRIQHAEAVEIPSSHWAWGMYWSPRRGLMLTLRTGPALRLTLASGRKVTVSTPQPDIAVLAIENARHGVLPSGGDPA